MIGKFQINNVRDQVRKDGSIVKRVILADPEMTVENFFHMDHKGEGYLQYSERVGQTVQIQIHNLDTNYSDTISVQGQLIVGK